METVARHPFGLLDIDTGESHRDDLVAGTVVVFTAFVVCEGIATKRAEVSRHRWIPGIAASFGIL